MDRTSHHRFTDKYFINSLNILKHHDKNPIITVQYFQKNNNAVMCGGLMVDQNFMHLPNVKVEKLPEGRRFNAYESAIHVTGPAQDIIDYETVLVGLLSRLTKVATNVANCKEAAGDKDVLFFPARFDYNMNQQLDGYAAKIGKVNHCSTDEQAIAFNEVGVGTMPHALIACFDGDTVAATLAYAEAIKDGPIISLVDYQNDCVLTSIQVANALEDAGHKLHGVRLDTSGNMIDVSLWTSMGPNKKTGVCPELVHNVRQALNVSGHSDVKIYVSGGFNPEKIKLFESTNVPVDGYGVGSYCFSGNFDFTADVVMINDRPQSKTGRRFKPIRKVIL